MSDWPPPAPHDATPAPATPAAQPSLPPAVGEPVAPAVATGKKSRKTTVIACGVVGLIVCGFFGAQMLLEGSGGETAQAAETTGPGNQTYLARVNGELVTWNEVAEEAMARHGSEVLDSVISRKIVQQACAKRQIAVTEAEIDAEINRIASRFKMPVSTWLEMLKTERNITPAEYRRTIIWPMLALKKLADDRVTVTEEDLNKAYVQQYGPRVSVRAILLDNLRQAQQIHDELSANPDKFEELARKHSIEPNSRSLDGQLPPIYKFYPVKKLEKQAFALQNGEISGIVQLEVNRWVILKSEGLTDPIDVDFASVKSELFSQLKEKRVQESVARIFSKIKSEAKIEPFSGGASFAQGTAPKKDGEADANPFDPTGETKQATPFE